MSRRDEAVEAAARAIFEEQQDLEQDDSWDDDIPEDWRDEWLYVARAAITEALAVLQPTVPNEVEALEALPVGTVLRGDAREEGVIVAHLTRLGWTEGEVPYDSTRLLFRHADLLGIDSWQVLWMPEVD